MANEKTPGTQIALSRKSRGMSMIPGLHGTKQWEFAMRKFNIINKTICKSVPKEIPRLMQPKKTFPTGSTYEGTWNELGISGTGTYEFPLDRNGQRKTYVGSFDNGQFHGNGQITYPDGTTLDGKWDVGELVERKLTFADGLEYAEKNWFYCVYPDRRYTIEYDEGLLPAGASNITSTPRARASTPGARAKPIPPGYYDTGDGFFDPVTNKICQYGDISRLVRAVCDREKAWIVENCRTEPDEPLGPCPFLYEQFLTPMLEAEYPPPPAARTRNYIEELQEIEAWAKQLMQARRQSYNPMSKTGRFSYHRRTTIHSNRDSGASRHGSASRHASSASRHGSRHQSRATSAHPSIDAPRKLMFDAETKDKGNKNKSDHDVRHRSTFCERTRSLFRERSLQDKDKDKTIQKIDSELRRSTSDLQKKTLKTTKQLVEEPNETSRSAVFQRDDDDDAFEIPQRHPNW